jgi:hypothetical protein
LLKYGYIDNDIILKLAACTLFWEAMSCLNLSKENLFVNITSRFYFRNSRKLKSRYPVQIREEARSIALELKPIKQDEQRDELYQSLLIEGVDAGEALLIASLMNSPDGYCLLTGDKRCLISLSNNNDEDIEKVKNQIRGKVICLEQIILAMIEINGFELILPKVLQAKEYDISLKSIFGSGEAATRENVISSLSAYIKDLQTQSNGILIDTELLLT